MKLRKKVTALGLALAIVTTPAATIFQNFGVHVDITAHAATTITTEAQLRNACKKGGKYVIKKDIDVTSPIEVTKDVTIESQIKNESQANVISCESKSMMRVFYINGGTLRLGSQVGQPNVVVRGGTTDTAYVETAPIVLNNGTLIINSGVVTKSKKVAIRATNRSQVIMNGGYIHNVQNSKCVAGAVVLTPSSSTNQPSTFEMNGGKITKNTCGAVTVGAGCTFTMNGGTITGNSGGAGNPSVVPDVIGGTKCTGFGGGVYNAGTFTMNAGTISNNSVTTHGGGVYNIGTFTMNGGDISNNTCGGVFNVSTFAMHGGKIKENTTHSGVYNTNYFAMSGGTIEGNTNTSKVGDGVFNAGAAKMEIAGSPYVNSNNEVAIWGNSGLSVTGALSQEHYPIMTVRLENASLGQTVATTPADGSNYTKYFNVVDLPAGYVLAGDGNRVAISAIMGLTYDYDGDGVTDETINYPYNSVVTVKSYSDVLQELKSKDKQQYYELDEKGLKGPNGEIVPYGSSITLTAGYGLTAIWTPKKYTVTYDYNGGTDKTGKSSSSIDTNYDDGFFVDFENVPTRKGYDFVGWATQKDATQATYTETKKEKNYYEDVTLYAVWKAKTVTITYNTLTGSAIASTVGTYENPPLVTAETPVLEGYVFEGWYEENGKQAVVGNPYYEDVTLIAKWVTDLEWNIQISNSTSNKISLTAHDETNNSAVTTYVKLTKTLKMTIDGTRSTSEGTTQAVMQYQIVDKGKQLVLTDSAWTAMKNNTLTISNHKNCQLFIRAISGNKKSKVYKTNGFSVDTKAPTVSGVKNGKIYKKAVRIYVYDSISGVKKITLNGKKIKSGKKVKKNGSYKLIVIDKSGHKKTIRFAIRK